MKGENVREIAISHPVATQDNAATIMYGLLHSFVELAGAFPSVKIDEQLASQASIYLTAAPPVDAVAPDKCAQDVYEHGQSIGFFDIPKDTANAICSGITAVTGARVDWHYFAGRVHMKALAPAVDAGALVDTLRLAIGYIGSSDRTDRHEHIARLRALSASTEAAAGEPVASDVQWEAHLLEAVQLTIDTLGRQLDLIAERAPGRFLDRAPVVRSLTAHKIRLERAVAERNASFAAQEVAPNTQEVAQPSNAPHVMRRIRRCDNETAAQVVLEHFGKEQRRAALEEAARVCDEKQDWYEKDRCIGQATAVGACADEIRALAKEGDKA